MLYHAWPKRRRMKNALGGMGVKVLVIGRGGREHAIAWKLAQSDKVEEIFAAPGNDGMANVARRVPIHENEWDRLIEFAKKEAIALTVVGPEQPLVDGIADRFRTEGLAIFGPSKAAAMIEGSKSFAKRLMKEYGIPTADYASFRDYEAAVDYVKRRGAPIVIKADGLAAGKGVTVAMSVDEALGALSDMMENQVFGHAGAAVVIEDYLEGEEFSLMAFVSGERVYPMVIAQDHKRVYEGDQGPNTGGMGAYSPVPQLPGDAVAVSVERILKPVARALVKEGRPYSGVLYAGLMWTNEGPKVIEFNCRFGDPETQVVLPRLESDLFDALLAIARGEEPELTWSDRAVCGIVLASEGYPGDYQKGAVIRGLDALEKETLVFHAGTKRADGRWIADGGRVLLVACRDAELCKATAKARSEAEKLKQPGLFFRRDIGWRALKTNGGFSATVRNG